MTYVQITDEHRNLDILTDELKYDVICLGTGLKECVVSGLLSKSGKKVLHLDRNDYYGGASASLNITQLYEKFRGSTDDAKPHNFGKDRDWYIDLIPKFLMATGKLVKLLIHSGVCKYLEFKSIEGSFVCREVKDELKVSKIPSTETEALMSDLFTFFEKNRFRQFLKFANKFDKDDKSTHGGLNPYTTTMQQLLDSYKLSNSTADFVGHAVALYRDDKFLEQPYLQTIERMKLYFYSLARYGSSPYLYPQYGLGELPQGFSRLAAIYGGTYKLSSPIDYILVDGDNFVGVVSEGKIAMADQLVCDPSYVPDKVEKIGQIVRAIVIMSHRPSCFKNEVNSCQIIIPNNQAKRKSDIYITCVGKDNGVTPTGFYLALVATTVETSKPQEEVRPGLDILGKSGCVDIFYSVDDLFVPNVNGSDSQMFVSSSYDATSHFETTCDDIIRMYHAITGEMFDMDKLACDFTDDE